MMFDTMSLDNRFSFTCPIFNAQVEMRSCVLLREKVYRGKRIATRRGCQACISGGKCPAAEIVRRIAFAAHDATDACASFEPVNGKLPADVLERVAVVRLHDELLRKYGVPANEVDLINTCGSRIEEQIGKAPRGKVEAKGARRTSQKAAPTRVARVATGESKQAVSAAQDAAARGDLSAAINN